VKIEIREPEPRGHGDYYTWTQGGYGTPHGEIWLDEAGSFRLDYLSEDDCDRLIRAASEIKPKVAAFRAEMAAPHGRRHLWKGRCQLCGKPEDDALHAPERCGSRPYPAGSEGDDGTECVRPKGHPGDHSDEPIPFDEPTATAPETGAAR
jgi:hypothetical protein